MNVAVKLHKENHQKAEARHGKGGGRKHGTIFLYVIRAIFRKFLPVVRRQASCGYQRR